MGSPRQRKGRKLNAEDVGIQPLVFIAGGRRWHLRLFVIAETDRFIDRLNNWCLTGRAIDAARLAQFVVYNREPNILTAIRRLLRLEDYSLKHIVRSFSIRDVNGLCAKAVSANLDQTLEQYLDAFNEVKKKIPNPTKDNIRAVGKSLCFPCLRQREYFLTALLRASLGANSTQ